MLRRTRYFLLGMAVMPVIATSAICIIYAFSDDEFVDNFIDIARKELGLDE